MTPEEHDDLISKDLGAYWESNRGATQNSDSPTVMEKLKALHVLRQNPILSTPHGSTEENMLLLADARQKMKIEAYSREIMDILNGKYGFSNRKAEDDEATLMAE